MTDDERLEMLNEQIRESILGSACSTKTEKELEELEENVRLIRVIVFGSLKPPYDEKKS